MAESHRSGGRTDVVHGGDARASRTRGHDPARELTPEEPTGGLLRDLSTRRGPARIRVDAALGDPRALFVLGHGAGGSIDAPDLEAVTAAVVPHGVTVVRVTQPYRVAGRKAPPPANHLDEAWVDVVRSLPRDLPLVVGGRSSGARVACRTAAELDAAGVVALAFPTHPPGKPERSRVDELPLDRPTLVLNGDRDPFGVPSIPSPGGQLTLHVLPGADHSLKRAADAAAHHVVEWLQAHAWVT